MTSIKQKSVLVPTIGLLFLAVANVAVVVAGWPVPRGVAEYGLVVLAVAVFVFVYRIDRESFYVKMGRRFVVSSLVSTMVLVGGFGVLMTGGVLS